MYGTARGTGTVRILLLEILKKILLYGNIMTFNLRTVRPSTIVLSN